MRGHQHATRGHQHAMREVICMPRGAISKGQSMGPLMGHSPDVDARDPLV